MSGSSATRASTHCSSPLTVRHWPDRPVDLAVNDGRRLDDEHAPHTGDEMSGKRADVFILAGHPRCDKGHFDGLARARQRRCREDLGARRRERMQLESRATADALANAAASVPFFSTTTLCAMTVFGILPVTVSAIRRRSPRTASIRVTVYLRSSPLRIAIWTVPAAARP